MTKNAWIILSSMCFFISGVGVGYLIHSKNIDKKIAHCNELVTRIKENNNKFLSNFSTLYHEIEGNEGTFTEMDERLMDMWID